MKLLIKLCAFALLAPLHAMDHLDEFFEVAPKDPWGHEMTGPGKYELYLAIAKRDNAAAVSLLLVGKGTASPHGRQCLLSHQVVRHLSRGERCAQR